MTQAAKPAGLASLGARLWGMAVPLLLITVLLWSGNAIVGRVVRDAVPPFTLALGRWTGALIVLLPFAWRHLPQDAPALRAHWKGTLLLGLLGVAGFNALLYSALHYTTATNALLVQSIQPSLILAFGFFLFKDRAGAVRIAAVAASILGVIVVVAQGDIASLGAMQFNRGDLLVLVGVFLWSLYTVLLRLKAPVHALSFLAATFLVGALAMLPLAAMELARGEVVTVDAASLAALGYVAIFPSLVAYLMFNRAVELVGSARAGQFINLMPLFGAGLAALLLGEPLGAHHWAGGALILVGILLFSRPEPRSAG